MVNFRVRCSPEVSTWNRSCKHATTTPLCFLSRCVCRWLPLTYVSLTAAARGHFPDSGCEVETLACQRAGCDGSGRSASLSQTNRSKSVARARLHAGRRPAADTTMVVRAPAKLAEVAGGSINFSSCCCRGETEFGSGQPSNRCEVIDFCRVAWIRPAGGSLVRSRWDSTQLTDTTCSIIVPLIMPNTSSFCVTGWSRCAAEIFQLAMLYMLCIVRGRFCRASARRCCKSQIFNDNFVHPCGVSKRIKLWSIKAL